MTEIQLMERRNAHNCLDGMPDDAEGAAEWLKGLPLDEFHSVWVASAVTIAFEAGATCAPLCTVLTAVRDRLRDGEPLAERDKRRAIRRVVAYLMPVPTDPAPQRSKPKQPTPRTYPRSALKHSRAGSDDRFACKREKREAVPC